MNGEIEQATDASVKGKDSIAGEFDRGFDGHWRRQVRVGLGLTPAARLRWLEQTMSELRQIQGRARQGRPVDTSSTPNARKDAKCP
jgi:hypothetical protein